MCNLSQARTCPVAIPRCLSVFILDIMISHRLDYQIHRLSIVHCPTPSACTERHLRGGPSPPPLNSS